MGDLIVMRKSEEVEKARLIDEEIKIDQIFSGIDESCMKNEKLDNDLISSAMTNRREFQLRLFESGKAASYVFTFQCHCGLEFSFSIEDKEWLQKHKPCCPQCGKKTMREVWIKPTMKPYFTFNPKGEIWERVGSK